MRLLINSDDKSWKVWTEHVVPLHCAICYFCSLGRPEGLGRSMDNMSCSLPVNICAFSGMSLTHTSTHTYVYPSTWAVSKTLGKSKGVPYNTKCLGLHGTVGRYRARVLAQGIAPPSLLLLLPTDTHTDPSSLCCLVPASTQWGKETWSGSRWQACNSQQSWKQLDFVLISLKLGFEPSYMPYQQTEL